MNDYPAGTVRRHPDWPRTRELAMRSAYQDGQYPGWTSWIRLRPSGTDFVEPAVVQGWPDAEITGAT